MSGAQGLLPTKSQKGRRKISLPWFRQNSVSAPHAGLSRQHTIDSPGSFRFFRQSSNNYQVAHFYAQNLLVLNRVMDEKRPFHLIAETIRKKKLRIALRRSSCNRGRVRGKSIKSLVWGGRNEFQLQS